MKLQLIACAVATAITSSSFGDIYQWFDGDGDGSLSLNSPYSTDDLANVAISGVTYWWGDFTNAYAPSSSWTGTNLHYADFSGANLRYGVFAYANLTNAIFANADLYSRNFSNSDLSNADLRNTDLYWLNGGQNDWDTNNWTGALYDDDTIFPSWLENPESYGLIYSPIPAPATLALLSVAGFATRRRRS